MSFIAFNLELNTSGLLFKLLASPVTSGASVSVTRYGGAYGY